MGRKKWGTSCLSSVDPNLLLNDWKRLEQEGVVNGTNSLEYDQWKCVVELNEEPRTTVLEPLVFYNPIQQDNFIIGDSGFMMSPKGKTSRTCENDLNNFYHWENVVTKAGPGATLEDFTKWLQIKSDIDGT